MSTVTQSLQEWIRPSLTWRPGWQTLAFFPLCNWYGKKWDDVPKSKTGLLLLLFLFFVLREAGRHKPTLTLNGFKNTCDDLHRTPILKTPAKGSAMGDGVAEQSWAPEFQPQGSRQLELVGTSVHLPTQSWGGRNKQSLEAPGQSMWLDQGVLGQWEQRGQGDASKSQVGRGRPLRNYCSEADPWPPYSGTYTGTYTPHV